MEAEIRISSTGLSAANDRAGFMWNWDGSTTSGQPAVRLILTGGGAEQLNLEHKDTANLATASVNWDPDTWHTVRVAVNGPTVSAYFDDALVAYTNSATTFQGRRFGLYAVGVNVDYDNVKVWVEDFTLEA